MVEKTSAEKRTAAMTPDRVKIALGDIALDKGSDLVSAIVAEIRRAERQRCMAAVCEKCAEGVPVRKLSEGWYHIAGNKCKAQRIRHMELG